jgi:D-alanine-D-alanine ligase
MRVGLTFDLRENYRSLGLDEEATAEFDSPETIAALEIALGELGHDTVRIGGITDLTHRLAGGERWDLVFNVAEGFRGAARESQVPALLDAFDVPYTFSDPLVLAVALHKAIAKQLLRGAGVPTPDFAVVEQASDCETIALPPPLFVKPVAEGTSKGVGAHSLVRDRRELPGVCERLLERFTQPVLVERFLPGREFTVGMIGSGRDARPAGVLEILLQARAEAGAYSYTNKSDWHDRVRYRLADDEAAVRAAELAGIVWRTLGCRDAGRVDFRCDDRGHPHFLEVNPLAGLNPIEGDLVILCGLAGMSYRSLIDAIVSSATARIAEQSDSPMSLRVSGRV